MFFTVIGGSKTASVVFHDDLSAGIRVLCPDGDVQRLGIGVHTMLDGVFHDGLQSQRRHLEMNKRRIVIHNKHLVKLRLFYCQVGAGVLQFSGKRYDSVAYNGFEIPAQIVGEIHRDLPSAGPFGDLSCRGYRCSSEYYR